MNRPHPLAVALVGLTLLAVVRLLGALGAAGALLTALQLVGALALSGSLLAVGLRLTPRGQVRAALGPGGWATGHALHRSLSARAARRAACDVRPSLAVLSRDARRRLPTTDFAAFIGRTVVGPLRAWRLYYSYRDVALVFAPPQTGKTAWLGGVVIDAPGAVLATSTKADVHAHTAALRARRGPVLVFNPESLGGLASTLRWSPVSGCEHPGIAQERALYLIDGARPGAGVSDGSFFESQAAKVLRAFLLAAALDGRGMADVAAWVQVPTDRTALRILRREKGRVPDGWEGELAQVIDTEAARTRESVYLSLGLATAFMGDPLVATMCSPREHDAPFDVAAWIAEKGTLYVLGSDRPHASIAPLLSCLTGWIFEEAKRVAAACRDGRLDPPLTLGLDEAALITPVPLDRWTADSGGRGIHLAVAVQSLSQLYGRWGERGGQTILNNSNLKLVYGGLTLPADLDAISQVCGSREEAVRRREDGSRPVPATRRLVRTLPPDQLRQLRPMHVLVLYRSAPPTIARITPVWQRADVRAARRQARAEDAA